MGMLLLDYPIDAQALAYPVCFARHIIKKVQKKSYAFKRKKSFITFTSKIGTVLVLVDAKM